MKRPWPINIEEEGLLLFPDEWSMREFEPHKPKQKKLGIVACQLFRLDPEQDHFRVFVEEEEELMIRELLIFGQVEFVTWVGGVALSEEREHILRQANRAEGSFRKQYEWRPAVMITDRPNPEQQEAYIQYMTSEVDSDWENFE